MPTTMKLLCFVTSASLVRRASFVPKFQGSNHSKLKRRNIGSTLTCVIQAPPSRRSSTTRIDFKQAAARPKKEPELHVENDSIESTWIQTLKVVGFYGTTFAVLLKVLSMTSWDPLQTTFLLSSAVLGWLFADFGTCIYHWGFDNYGNADTPVLGSQIAAFQGHHLSPWTITCRGFANNLHKLTTPTTPIMVSLLFLPFPPEILAGLASAVFWIVMSQELHKQAHMARPALYACVLQSLGIAVSRREHGLHHSSTFEGHYGIVSGIWNRLLDESQFFRKLEAVIYRWNGVEPTSWKLDPKLKNEALSL